MRIDAARVVARKFDVKPSSFRTSLQRRRDPESRVINPLRKDETPAPDQSPGCTVGYGHDDKCYKLAGHYTRFGHGLFALGAALFAASVMGGPSAYPSKPIRILVGFSPGGASDLTTRIIGQKLQEHLGQPVIIDNRAGASGTIAAQIVAKAARDGYTLLSGATSILALNPALSSSLGYDPVRDFAPISQTVSMPQLLVVHPSVKATSVRELIALAKARPGELNYSSSGTGSSSHLAAELFMYMTGVRMVHVPYKGSGQSIPALIAGQVQLIFDPMPTSLPHVKSGKLRALGISTTARSPAIPELPTLAEAGVPGYESSLWYGLLAPAGTSKPVVTRLHEAVTHALKTPDLIERFAGLGAEPTGSTPAAFAGYIQIEVQKWGKLISSAGIRAD